MAKFAVWQPFSEMLALDTVMSQMMESANRVRSRAGNRVYPLPVDLTESVGGYTIQALLTGVRPEDLAIDFANEVLTIRAERTIDEPPEEVMCYHVRELGSGTYERSFRFPLPIDADAIEASYEHGILLLHLPKADSVKPRRISVQKSTS